MRYQPWIYWNIDSICNFEEEKESIIIPTGYVKFLNICRNIGSVDEIGDFEKHKRRWCYIRKGYSISKTTYKKAREQFKQQQRQIREKWENYPNIFQLVDILRKAFNANNGAKNVYNRGLRSHHYWRKDEYMSKAIRLAKKINLPFFSWGCQYDHDCINYEVVLYFQIGNAQISFHTSDIDSAPEFSGEWIGEENYVFPFSITTIKKLAKKNDIDPKQIKEIESEPFDQEPDYTYWESSHTRNYHYNDWEEEDWYY